MTRVIIPCSDAVDTRNMCRAVDDISGGCAVAVPGGVSFDPRGVCRTWDQMFPPGSKLTRSQKRWLKEQLPHLVAALDGRGVYLNDPRLNQCLMVIIGADRSLRMGVRSAILSENILSDGSPRKTNIGILVLVDESINYPLFRQDIEKFERDCGVVVDVKREQRILYHQRLALRLEELSGHCAASIDTSKRKKY